MREQAEPNLHHVLYNRIDWNARELGRDLRDHKAMISRIEVETHEELHRRTCAVPTLGPNALKFMTEEFNPNNPSDTISSITEFQRIIKRYNNRAKKPHQIEREMGKLTIWALDLQKCFLEDEIIGEPSGGKNVQSGKRNRRQAEK